MQKKLFISSLYVALPMYAAAILIAKVARSYSKQFNDEYNQKNESLWKVLTSDMIGIVAATVVQAININYALKIPAVAKGIAVCDTGLASVSCYVVPRFIPVNRWCANYHLGAIGMTLVGVTCWNEFDKHYPDKYKLITEFFSKK